MSVCVALVIQHAKRMRRIIMSPVGCLSPHFSTLSHERHERRTRNALSRRSRDKDKKQGRAREAEETSDDLDLLPPPKMKGDSDYVRPQ
jgi:hypothetical protein